MLVFNTSSKEITYRGKPIPADGGSLEYPGLIFIPNRDRELEVNHLLSFGALPAWFLRQKAIQKAEEQKKIQAAAALPVTVTVTATEVAEVPKVFVAEDVDVKDDVSFNARSKKR